jgi:hypothetical protein
MRKRLLRLILAGFAFLAGGAASAEPTIRLTLATRNSVPTVDYVTGLLTAFAWSNASLMHSNERPLFCVPANSNMQVQPGLTLLQSYLNSHPQLANAAVGMGMLMALEAAYPCAPH